jgi:hypothetical protein
MIRDYAYLTLGTPFAFPRQIKPLNCSRPEKTRPPMSFQLAVMEELFSDPTLTLAEAEAEARKRIESSESAPPSGVTRGVSQSHLST